MYGVPNKLILVLGLILVLIFGVFAFVTTDAIDVAVGGAAWFVILIICVIIFLISLVFLAQWKSHPRLRLLFIWITCALILTIILLSVYFQPFNASELSSRFGLDPIFDPSKIPDPLPDSSYSASSDYTSLDLTQFMPASMDQGQCQDCWAVSNSAVLHARLRMQGVQSAPNQFRNSCNSSNWLVSPQVIIDGLGKGCPNGEGTVFDGFKFAQDHDIQSMSCVPYYVSNCSPSCREGQGVPTSASTCVSSSPYIHGDCSGPSTLNSTARVTKVYSVSGETNMIKELHDNGPISCPVSLYQADGKTYAAWALTGPGTGLFGNYGNFTNPNYISRPLYDGDQYNTFLFSAKGHVLTVMGYGVINGVKYWNVMNSWGPNWGIKGYSKIERGINAWLIESTCGAAFIKPN